MNSTILFVLMIFTFLAVLVGAFFDLQNTRRAIKRDEKSAASNRALGPQTEGFTQTAPN
jgi:hypothetical protein